MTDETLSAEPGLETAIPEVETTEPTDLQTQQVEGTENAGEEQPVEADDFEEIEWSGKTFKAPKGLKDGVLMHADYTRKTQEVASRAKEIESREARAAELLKANEEELGARAQLHHVNSEIARFKDFGWVEYQQLKATDPVAADEAWAYKQHLTGLKSDYEQKISSAETSRTQAAQQDFAKRVEQTQEHARKIKGWTPDMDKQVIEFMANQGIDEAFVKANWSPKMYDLMRLAMIGSRRETTPPTPKPPPLQPLQTVGGKTNPVARKSLADLEMDEYVAARKAGRKG